MFAAQAQADCTGIDQQLALNVIEDNNISFNNLKPDTNRLFDFMKSILWFHGFLKQKGPIIGRKGT